MRLYDDSREREKTIYDSEYFDDDEEIELEDAAFMIGYNSVDEEEEENGIND